MGMIPARCLLMELWLGVLGSPGCTLHCIRKTASCAYGFRSNDDAIAFSWQLSANLDRSGLACSFVLKLEFRGLKWSLGQARNAIIKEFALGLSFQCCSIAAETDIILLSYFCVAEAKRWHLGGGSYHEELMPICWFLKSISILSHFEILFFPMKIFVRL